MRPSISLGTIAGVRAGLNWSVLLIAGVLTWSLSSSLLPASAPGFAGTAYLVVAVAVSALFLGSILAHELGHSIVARRNGIRVDGITLYALGGVAVLDGEPDKPGVAARIALAGPAVSLVIGAASIATAFAAAQLGVSTLTASALAWLGVVNIVLAVFNMLPALPLDGGRVLQAALWWRNGNRHRATISAARGGRWIGGALIAFGLWQSLQGGFGLWTMFIGLFVMQNATAEEMRARMQLAAEQRPATPTSPESVIDTTSRPL